ncbi:MAG: CRISPR-associated protein Cas4 [Candidatus Auribacterota bacterium]|nr:CRISPR-associated protein Cas4 [Candidatus Auribacterota bacterium]
MYSEDELIPISALQHLLFCERQCALIHLERLWTENRFTAEGRILHERVERGGWETRGDVRTEYSVLLKSLRLGVAGIADVVEFHRAGEIWRPFPVEHKRGRPKRDRCDEVQLCSQALCLEEMLEVRIECGALYYGKIRHRKDVNFDKSLREETENTARQVHELFEKGITPAAEYGEKCKSCSLSDLCVPKSKSRYRSATNYLNRIIETELSEHDK